MSHERVEIPSRWRRLQRRKLRWDNDIESPPRVQQRLAPPQPLGGIQERAPPDAERLLGLRGGEDRPARGEQTAGIA